MNRSRKCLLGVVFAGVMLAAPGCPNSAFFRNQTATLNGNVNLVFVNDTDARAIFSSATWNPLDRGFPFTADFNQVALDPVTSTTQAFTCGRLFAIGTQTLRDWIAETDEPDQADFQAERLTVTVQFRVNDPDVSADEAPLLGTATGILLEVGNDFSCDDQVIVTFVEDPAQPGGYRLDYQVIRDDRDLSIDL